MGNGNIKGVLIPFMEMPKSCAKCFLKETDYFSDNSGTIYTCTCYSGGDVLNGKSWQPFNFVPDWCPLREIEIPDKEGSLSRGKKFKLVEIEKERLNDNI